MPNNQDQPRRAGNDRRSILRVRRGVGCIALLGIRRCTFYDEYFRTKNAIIQMTMMMPAIANLLTDFPLFPGFWDASGKRLFPHFGQMMAGADNSFSHLLQYCFMNACLIEFLMPNNQDQRRAAGWV
jgi:hypothetical protein